MDTLRVERDGAVAIASFNRGVTNAIGPGLVAELSELLQSLMRDTKAGALVLTSANEKFFSIGLDLPVLTKLSRPDFTNFYRAFNRLCLDLYVFPKPTVAAITGHATAGGCVLALCCDHRLIAEGRRLMGLNEIKLGLPLPYPAACILRELAGAAGATEIIESGEFFPPETLLRLGLIERILPVERVRAEAREAAEVLASRPRPAFQAIKRSRVEVVEERILRMLAEKERIFIDCWFGQETRKRLVEAAEMF